MPEFSEHDDFIVVNPVFLNLEDPLRVETFVEPLDHGATFNVVEHISIHALPSLDLLRRKRFFEQVSIHVSTFLIEMNVFLIETTVLLSRTYTYRLELAEQIAGPRCQRKDRVLHSDLLLNNLTT